MLVPNDVLQNRYRIIRQLGQGGMGTVYEAVDERFESQVALKQTHFTEEMLRRQFEREARLLNKLRHPAMTRVIDYFSESNNQFLVMDYVQGEDLGQMLESNGSRPFPTDEVLAWGDQLLDALDYIHSQNPPIIHRDIKPQNLKLTERNRIILLDFGLAKGTAAGMTTVATTKSVLGYSLSYAPLEQILKVEGHWIELLSVSNKEEVQRILARGTDPRSDLYSLAATLLHLLTGKAPPNAPTRALSVWTGRPDSLYSAFGYGITREVGDVLARAMALMLDERFMSAAEMREALQKASRTAQSQTLPPTIVDLPPTQRRPHQESTPLPSTVASPPKAKKPPEPIPTIATPVTPSSQLRFVHSAASQESLSHISEATRREANPKTAKVLWAASVTLFLLWIIFAVGGVAGNLAHLLLLIAFTLFAVNLFVIRRHSQISPPIVREESDAAPRSTRPSRYVRRLFAEGEKQIRNKDYDGAIQNFERVLSLQPFAPTTNYYLATLYSVKGNRDKAFTHLTLAVEQGFKDFAAINSSDRLNFLRSQPNFREYVRNGYKFPSVKATSEDAITKLDKLGKLKTEGLITEEEYAEQKRKLLGS